MSLKPLRSLLILTIYVFASLVPLAAQTAATGALTGTVTDASGAVVPGATVTANSETGQQRTATTGADGGYKFSLLPPGTYRVKFNATGFRESNVPAVVVNVTETPVLNQRMDVGQQSEQVTVTTQEEAVQTATSTLGTVVTSADATALPLNTRNYTNLLGLSAGANASVNNATGLGKGVMEIATNGASPNQNTFQMDGVAINGFSSNGNIGQAGYPTFGTPNPDTIAEFKIQTSLYDAGYGRNPGANVNVVTKSGTDAFHGSAFEFFRNTDLNANDFFRNRTCGQTPAICSVGGNKLVLNQNQYGGVVGGPIKNDKLFFFTSYQQTWQKNGIASQGYVSGINLPAIPLGDRSNTAAFQAALGAQFCKSLTNPGGAGAGAGLQVACDGSNINPVAVKILQLKNPSGAYWLPGSSVAGATQSGVTYSIPAYDKEYQGMLNLDYILNSTNTIAGRYYTSNEPQTNNFVCSSPCVPDVPANIAYSYTDAVVRLTTIVTPSLVNELRSSLNRSMVDAGQNFNIDPTTVGMAPETASRPLLPAMTFTGLYSAGNGPTTDTHIHTTSYQFADQVSWTRGKHTLRAGGEMEFVDWNWYLTGFAAGSMTFQTFNDFLIGLPGNCGVALAGVCNGSAFSNITSTGTASIRSSPVGVVHGYRAHDANLFVQDDFKVNQRLTLNLGLRWEYDGNVSDKYGNDTTVWTSAIANTPLPGSSPATGSYAGWVVPTNYSTNTYGPLPAGIIKSGSNSVVRNSVPWDDFAPRFGFAWQPLSSNKLAIRGGYGFFFDRVGGANIINAVQQSAPYAITLGQGPTTNQFASLAQPWQSTAYGTFPARWVNFANGTGSNISQPTIQDYFTPLVYSWNLDAQYQFLPKWVLDLAYVGSHGIHQAISGHIINEAALSSAGNFINGVTTNTASNALLRAPYLGFSPAGLSVYSTGGDYKANSLQATVRKTLSYGLTLQAAYTWIRAFSDTGGGTSPAGANTGDPNNLAQQYGLNPIYRPQRLVLNYSWNIPSGKLKGITYALLGGWNLSGVTTIQDGNAMSIFNTTGGGAFGLNGSGAQSRAQMAAGATYADIPTSGGLEARLGGASGGPGYFNTAAFTTIPTVGVINGVGGGTGWGNSGVGVILGPGQFNFDTALEKSTRVGGIHENGMLQFRAEFFNLFNHPQFNTPGNNQNSPTFGQITSTSVNPRLVQLALKYMF